MNSSDYNLITFKAISTFITDLSEIFGSTNHSLKLYDRLISKTTLSHDVAINKHISAFRDFCIANRDAILNKNESKLVVKTIEYSPKVFVDISQIFTSSDKETTNVIWKHLLTISALVDPAGKAKEILKKSNDSKEADFLTNIINKVESHVNPNANPLEAVSSIMSSGVFNELLTGMNDGMQNGSLDLTKLMGTVQQMCASFGVDNNQPGGADAMNMINNMVNMMAPGQNANPSKLEVIKED
jgi:hypothetical protein